MNKRLNTIHICLWQAFYNQGPWTHSDYYITNKYLSGQNQTNTLPKENMSTRRHVYNRLSQSLCLYVFSMLTTYLGGTPRGLMNLALISRDCRGVPASAWIIWHQNSKSSFSPVFPLRSPQQSWVIERLKKEEDEWLRHRAYKCGCMCICAQMYTYLWSIVPGISIYKQKSDTPKTLTF